MLRRWLIRSLVLTLLTLCVVAWVGSYWRSALVVHTGVKEKYSASLGGGLLWLEQHDTPPISNQGWYLGSLPRRVPWDWKLNLFENARGPDYVGIFVPLWFPTILSAGCLWLVWRKTRPKYSGKGFPVEVAGGGEQEATKA